jgi:hypothetical protein
MQAAFKMGATREEILETILLAGLISNSSVLANAYRIVDDKFDKCLPCELKGIGKEPEGKINVKPEQKQTKTRRTRKK